MKQFTNYLPPTISAERLNKIEDDLSTTLQWIGQTNITLSSNTVWYEDTETNSYIAEFKLPELDRSKKYRLEISIISQSISKKNYQTLSQANIAHGVLKFTANTIVTLYCYGTPPNKLSADINLVVNIYAVQDANYNSVLMHIPTTLEQKNSTDNINSVHYSSSNIPDYMGKLDFWNWGRIGEEVPIKEVSIDYNNFQYEDYENETISVTPLTLTIKNTEKSNIDSGIYLMNSSTYYNALTPEERKSVIFGNTDVGNPMAYKKIASTSDGLQLFATLSFASSDAYQYNAFVVDPQGKVIKLNFDDKIENATEYVCCSVEILKISNNIITIIVKHRKSVSNSSETLTEVYDLKYNAASITDSSISSISLELNPYYKQLITLHYATIKNTTPYRFYFGSMSDLEEQEYALILEEHPVLGGGTSYTGQFYLYDKLEEQWKHLGNTPSADRLFDIRVYNIYKGIFCSVSSSKIYFVKDGELKTLTLPVVPASGSDNSWEKYPFNKGFKHIAPNKVSVFYADNYYFYISKCFETFYYVKNTTVIPDFSSYTSQWNAIQNIGDTVVIRISDSSTLLLDPINGVRNGPSIQNLNLLNSATIGNYFITKNNEENSITNFMPIYTIDSEKNIQAYQVEDDGLISKSLYNIYDNNWKDISNDTNLNDLVVYNSFPGKGASSSYSEEYIYLILQNHDYTDNIYQLHEPFGYWWFGLNKNIVSFKLSDVPVEGTNKRALFNDFIQYEISYKKPEVDSDSSIILGENLITGDIIQYMNTPPFGWVKYREITQYDFYKQNLSLKVALQNINNSLFVKLYETWSYANTKEVNLNNCNIKMEPNNYIKIDLDSGAVTATNSISIPPGETVDVITTFSYKVHADSEDLDLNAKIKFTLASGTGTVINVTGEEINS